MSGLGNEITKLANRGADGTVPDDPSAYVDHARGRDVDHRAVNVVRLPTAAASEATAFLSMLDRMARDPSVDIERVERFTTLYERAIARSAKAAYDAALADMQPALPIIDKRGKSHNGKFALWEDIAEGIVSVTREHGFSLTFRVKPLEKAVEVTAVLAHRDGHREETSFPFPHDHSGSKNPIQAVGSSISYGKRYTASALLNIIAREEDDDGEKAIKLKSSYAAKKDGTSELHQEILNLIRSAVNLAMLRHIDTTYRDDFNSMPVKWRQIIKDEYALKWDELQAASASE